MSAPTPYSDLIGYEYVAKGPGPDSEAGNTIRVTGPSDTPGYVEVEVKWPDGRVAQSVRLAEQVRLLRRAKERLR